MPRPVISVENISKRYLVGHRTDAGRQYRYTALGDVIEHKMRNMARKAADIVRGRQIVQGDAVEDYWALKNVSFEVQEGEVLGIIGRNGAGKSTLLKILSRITEPTSGRIALRGRVASLLEVGTGFHPELTGRENIFLNGAILGMTRAEIRKKLDKIVAFAEIDKFLDTPVKRYSSGMYVRLAFAVAAHLEPEILVIDEVLAVGDAEFQKKCLGKIDEVSRLNGRTVLFVSHNMAAISELSHRAVLLQEGSIANDGPVSEVLSMYLASSARRSIYVATPDRLRTTPYIARAEVVTSGEYAVQEYGEPLDIRVHLRHPSAAAKGALGIHVVSQLQTSATTLYVLPPHQLFPEEPGTTVIHFRIPSIRLNIGRFHLRFYLHDEPRGRLYDLVDGVCDFEVVRHDFFSWWLPQICTYHEDFSFQICEEPDPTAGMANVAEVKPGQ
jgi:homopolymeric O-antigen transport system ATP-binding protein